MMPPSISNLKVFNYEEEKWVWADSFVKFLRDNLQPTDKFKSIKCSNLITQFSKQPNGMTLIGEKKALSLFAVLRYIFHHVDDMATCKALAKEIQRRSFYDTVDDYDSMLSLYKKITKSTLWTSYVYNHISLSEIEESAIPSLYAGHHENFDENQWKQICIFEYHLSNLMCPEEDMDFNDSLKIKWEFFSLCQEAAKVGKSLSQMNTKIMKNRIQRRKEADKSNEALIYSSSGKHIPYTVENDLCRIVNRFFPNKVNRIVVVDDITSVLKNVFNIYCELNEDTLSDIQYRHITECLERNLISGHQTQCNQILFFCKNAFLDYERPNGNFARFHLQDDIELKKLQEKTVYHQRGTIQTDSQDFEDGICLNCFSEERVESLTLTNFSTFKEWILDIPLPLQFILEIFLNPKTLALSKDLQKTLETKVTKLYSTYDTLLNIYNRNYFGIFQEAQTANLAINYHSVKSVFAVTNAAGATTSLLAAEENLKRKAMDDTCYFNTYRKKCPLTYETCAGNVTKDVSIQDCYLVLMLDNLVRLTFRNDPNPGESRSGQLCTLPITLQGLPKDSAVVSEWHDVELCDNTEKCPCKKPVQIKKEDIKKTILELTVDETECLKKFHSLCRWNSTTVKQLLSKSELEFLHNQINVTLPVRKDDEASLNNIINTKDNSSNVASTNMDDDGDEVEDKMQDLEDLLDKAVLEEVDMLEFDTDIFLHRHSIHSEPDHDEILNEDVNDIDVSIMEESFQNLSLQNGVVTDDINIEKKLPCTPQDFGLHKYVSPSLITRHPPPATGRDDDILKLQEIIEDVTMKSGNRQDKILCGPDNKIGGNLLKLTKLPKYSHVLPEFPLLHLRKSKINTLFSAYKDAGLRHLMMFMRDDDRKEWSKLVSAEHIDVATRYVKRIAMSLRLAFLIAFMHDLPSDQLTEIENDIQNLKATDIFQKWDGKFLSFMERGKDKNTTFALHFDMLQHCEEVIAIALAERLGGPDGYHLLLASVKSSLRFQFLNGASSYAPFCTQLVIEHNKCGVFHQNLKKCLFSTPIGTSSVNFACDTKREMDHRDALKGFRSGSNISSIKCRMSLIDSLNEVQQNFKPMDVSADQEQDDLGWRVTSVDIKHIVPLAGLILRRGGLSIHNNDVPVNVYSKELKVLPLSILDTNCLQVGDFMIMKYLVKENLFELKSSDLPVIKDVIGPRELIRKVKVSSGITLKRSCVKVAMPGKSNRDINEEKRKKAVKRESKQIDCLSSNMNTCQALVKPDCSKRKVMKSTGVQKALVKLVQSKSDSKDISKYIMLGTQRIPNTVSQQTSVVTVEFAGVKFKTRALSGREYIKYVENAVVKNTLYKFPKLRIMTLCEEKYSFTPDNFKAATRAQRTTSTVEGIAHLKTGDQIISSSTFCKAAVVTTPEGKSLISTYLAAHAQELHLSADVIVDIDSELYIEGCMCESAGKICQCKTYSVPIRCSFNKVDGTPSNSTVTTLVC